MTTVIVHSYADKLTAKIKRHLGVNLLMATQYLRNKVRENISRPGRRGTAKAAKSLFNSRRGITNRSVRYRRGATGRMLGFTVHSRPGEYPRLQTGLLRASINYELDEVLLSAIVGTNVEYATHLESMRLRRQFLTRTLREEAQVIQGKLLRPMA